MKVAADDNRRVVLTPASPTPLSTRAASRPRTCAWNARAAARGPVTVRVSSAECGCYSCCAAGGRSVSENGELEVDGAVIFRPCRGDDGDVVCAHAPHWRRARLVPRSPPAVRAPAGRRDLRGPRAGTAAAEGGGATAVRPGREPALIGAHFADDAAPFSELSDVHRGFSHVLPSPSHSPRGRRAGGRPPSP
jgi:hypothetical protein